MDKLIPLRDFVLEQDLPHPIGRTAGQMVKYGLFLSQKLELWMFVPAKNVNGEWIVLEEPKSNGKNILNFKNDSFNYSAYWEKQNKEYQEAKERCLFEGIKYTSAKDKGSYDIVHICKETAVINYPEFWEGKTVEHLIPYNLVLTESAKKIINV